MNLVTAFAAVGLTAVSWDGTLSRAGARSLRHALDYREPYCRMSDNDMVLLIFLGSFTVPSVGAECPAPAAGVPSVTPRVVRRRNHWIFSGGNMSSCGCGMGGSALSVACLPPLAAGLLLPAPAAQSPGFF